MKKLLIILLCFLSVHAFAQTDTALGKNGHYIPVKSLNLLHPLFNPNDSTAAFDSARYYLSTFAYNGTNDSLVITFLDGTRFAVKKPSSSGGTGSGWKTVNTNDMTDTLSGNVAIGNGLNTPLAKLQVSNTGLGISSSDSSKGILLISTDTATLGNQVYSPPMSWIGSQYFTTYGRALPYIVQAKVKTVQGSNGTNGYLSFRARPASTGSAFTEDVLTIGANPATGTTSVGINTAPSNNSGAVLNVGGTINQISGNFSIPTTTWNINQAGSNILDYSVTTRYLRLLSSTSGTVNNGTVTDKPMAVGRQDSTDLGAQLSVTSTGRGFLFPRMTTTQRDSINLQITGWNIVNGGTGYTGSGTVVISAGPVPTSATTASISSTLFTRSSGVVTAITIGSGFFGSYNSTPTATFTGGGGTGLVVTPIMQQFITEGMTIYNTTVHKFQGWNGTSWDNLN